LPVHALSETIYADVLPAPGARLEVRAQYEERAAYVVEGSVELSSSGGTFEAGQLLVFRPGGVMILKAPSSPVRLMVLGGEPMDGSRSSRERIEQAKADWKTGKFAPVPAETEFIPLPEFLKTPGGRDCVHLEVR
jgi:redox-sensitive bicupin YhaK (pirin superfamily)